MCDSGQFLDITKSLFLFPFLFPFSLCAVQEGHILLTGQSSVKMAL